jgi:phage N-6-adenine-methyltransferase
MSDQQPEAARITAGMFTNRTDEWGTPKALFNTLNERYKFTLDPCASHENAKCERYITAEQDGLKANWGGSRVFVNPPYSQSALWLKKCYEEHLAGTFVVVLIPCRTDTRYFHDYAMKASTVFLIKGRLKYNDARQSAPFPSCLLVFNGTQHNRTTTFLAMSTNGAIL